MSPGGPRRPGGPGRGPGRGRRPAPASADWWFADRTGRGGWTIAQWPNPALVVFGVTVVLRWILAAAGAEPATLDATLLVGRGALIVFGLDELVRGHNPFRRVVGAAVLAWQLVALATG